MQVRFAFNLDFSRFKKKKKGAAGTTPIYIGLN